MACVHLQQSTGGMKESMYIQLTVYQYQNISTPRNVLIVAILKGNFKHFKHFCFVF